MKVCGRWFLVPSEIRDLTRSYEMCYFCSEPVQQSLVGSTHRGGLHEATLLFVINMYWRWLGETCQAWPCRNQAGVQARLPMRRMHEKTIYFTGRCIVMNSWWKPLAWWLSRGIYDWSLNLCKQIIPGACFWMWVRARTNACIVYKRDREKQVGREGLRFGWFLQSPNVLD